MMLGRKIRHHYVPLRLLLKITVLHTSILTFCIFFIMYFEDILRYFFITLPARRRINIDRRNKIKEWNVVSAPYKKCNFSEIGKGCFYKRLR